MGRTGAMLMEQHEDKDATIRDLLAALIALVADAAGDVPSATLERIAAGKCVVPRVKTNAANILAARAAIAKATA